MPGEGCCGCCSAKELVDSEVKEDTEDDKQDVKKQGFVVKRHCTDILCLIIWAVHVVAFFVLTFWGMQDGNPHKLYQPRDYQGAYCGVETNWNNGPNLAGQTKQSYMMNVTSMADITAKQFLCSDAARSFLTGAGGLGNAADIRAYESACCLIPNQDCSGSLSLGGVISGSLSTSNAGLDVITNKMNDLSNQATAFNLWSTAGANGGIFTDIWNEATKNFVKVCLTECTIDSSALTGSTARTYTYSPHPDQPLYKAWTKVVDHFQGTSFMDAFVFQALPPSMCPYPAEYCVPMPGVVFSELSNGYCTIQMGADIINAVGSTMASSWETFAGDNIVESITETLGALWGDFEQSIDTFILTCVCCFAIGLIYLVILRFTVKFCVWFAIFLVFLCLVFGGGLSWVASIQCKGNGLLETTHQTGVAVVVAGSTAVSNAISGDTAVSEECDSSLTVRCADYRGVQTRSRSGSLCQAWDSTTPWDHSLTYSSALFPHSGLNSTPGMMNNYCRNPFNAGWDNSTSEAAPPYTIWCFTTNTEMRWELCTPIGVIAPACEHGYAVSGETTRKTLEILGYVIWSLAGIWLLLILCFQSRIRLAIALNSVAAKFVANTPTVLIVPVLQAIVGCAWVLIWMLLASFLLSQVPGDYMPTGYYATYAEAYGTNTTAGACTGKWPTGFVWQTASENCDLTDPLVPKCWKCAPPRFIFDWRFAIVFFSFLWNNAFLIALGQCMIAGAVGVWFFMPNQEKGKMQKGQALRTANWNVWRYHTGSLAFGSFILALIQFIRYLMKYLEKQAQAQKNRVMVIVLRVLQCCIYCFERFIQFLNKNAYIQIAIRGSNFCSSAKKAFQIIMNNILRFGTVAILGHVIHCIGYIFIMASTLVVGYFLLKLMHEDISPVVPMILYGFMSYIVGMLFMNVFGLAVDTCLQCVIFAEEECPDGDFVPKCLRSVIDKSKAGKEPDDADTDIRA